MPSKEKRLIRDRKAIMIRPDLEGLTQKMPLVLDLRSRHLSDAFDKRRARKSIWATLQIQE
jgi:hypothetical protein